MGQKTAYIIQRIYHIRDNKNEGRKQNGGYVVGATFGFYCQWGYGVYLLRDTNSLLQRVRLKKDMLDLGEYSWSGATEKIIKSEYYCIRDDKFIEAPEKRKILNKTDIGTELERNISVEKIKDKLMQIYNAHYNFRESMDPTASYPFMEKLDIWVSERIDDIDTKDLFQYIPMKDFRNEKDCKDYFEYFENNDGATLITLYGGEDYCPDIREVRIIDGRDRYGQFVPPDYYIQQYIDDEIEYAKSRGKKSNHNWLKKNWKNFVGLIEDFQGAKIIKGF